jgi:seryl-tRNA synthetase
MRQRDGIIEALKATGELFEPAPGLVGLAGGARAHLARLDALLAATCRAESRDEWSVPAALPLAVLQRADYFASFPQWLTVATHLTDDASALERIARSEHPAHAVSDSCVAPSVALPPAVCYHVYAALADTTVSAPRTVTAQGCCWRHEGDRLRVLERGWSFTMREIVCIGTEAECVAFRDRGIAVARAFAARLGLDGEVVQAEDPFFAPTGRARAVLQRLRELKQELRLPIGDGDTVAAASFNLHDRFFGEAFDIRLRDGSPAFTACVAFGLERWLLASLVAAAVIPSAARDLQLTEAAS